MIKNFLENTQESILDIYVVYDYTTYVKVKNFRYLPKVNI